MPNILSASGLTVAPVTEIVANLTTSFQAIYGADINVNPNSPDGQLIGILAQSIEDVLQLIVQVYNSFSLDSAFGTILDQRVAMSGLQRKQGTFTVAFVQVTVSQSMTLPGQDQLIANPSALVFTVADTAQNQYQLVTTQVIASPGTYTFQFKCTILGQVLTTPNTIQTIITPLIGVVSVNNPSTAQDVEGLPEETDPQLKIRQANSYFLQAVAPADSIRAALINNVPGCVDALVPENDTGSVVDGVPAYGIWVIVNGGQPSAVANAIYVKKNMGCAMRGAQSFQILRPQGNTATMLWDWAIGQPLYIRATLFPQVPGQMFDTTADAMSLANALIYRLAQSPNVGDVVVAMQKIEPTAIVANCQVSSDGVTWEQIVSPSSFQSFFTVSATNITLTNA